MSTSTRCEYLAELFPQFEAIYAPLPQFARTGANQSGYGSRIRTDYMIRIDSRKYRVYCCCWSNCGTLFIDTKDHKFLVVSNYDLEACR